MPKPKGLPKTGGRVAGSKNVATKEAKVALEQLAQEHTEAALAVLVDVMQNAETSAAPCGSPTAPAPVLL